MPIGCISVDSVRLRVNRASIGSAQKRIDVGNGRLFAQRLDDDRGALLVERGKRRAALHDCSGEQTSRPRRRDDV